MAFLQKLVNIVTIIACVGFLFYLKDTIDTVSTDQDEILSLTSLIGNGVALSEEQTAKLTSILAIENAQLRKSSPYCFLKAYSKVVLEGKADPEKLFNIFEPGKQFGGVSTCTHYYELLIYRASLLQTKEKVRIENILNELLSAQFQSKKAAPICVYFYAYNSQITAKEQIAQIIGQVYSTVNVVVDVDGSRDNTHMFVKYTLEERKDKSRSIQVNTETQRKGFINNFERIIQKQCQEDSIVLVLQKDSVLLSQHALKMVNDFFSNNQNKEAAVFKSLTIPRENIQDSQAQSFPNSYPVLAFKKPILPKFKTLISKISEKSKEGSPIQNYQPQLFTLSLLKDSSLQQKIGFANEAIIYQRARRPFEQEALSQFFLEQ